MNKNTHTPVPRIIAICLAAGMALLGAPQALAAPPGWVPPSTGQAKTHKPEAGHTLLPQSATTIQNTNDPRYFNDIDVGRMPTTADPNFKAAGAHLPPQPGDKVPHKFDAVIANVYDSPDDYPPTPAESLSHDRIDTMLKDAADWWSGATGLVFDFNTGIRYRTINTTCDTFLQDAAAAMGEKYDAAVYTETNRDLLVFQVNRSCEGYLGLTFTISQTGDLFGGGVFTVVVSDGDDPELNAYTVAHEFGHTIGLGHSNVGSCAGFTFPGDDTVGPLWDGSTVDGCFGTPYTDWSTIMGQQSKFNDPVKVTLNTVQREILHIGWDDVTVVDKAVTKKEYTLSRFDLSGTGKPTGIQLAAPNDPYEYIASLEYRAADAVFPQAGVYITKKNPVPVPLESGETVLIPETNTITPVGFAPTTADNRPLPVALEPGDTYISVDANVHIRTLSVDATTAKVEVTITDKPGVMSTVSITKNGDTLEAVDDQDFALDPKAAVTYQWVRNGTPIPGATNQTYKPALPDPNAVYRVEATFTLAGYTTTTRTSRGIIPDDRRLTANNSDLTWTLLDANGKPVDCEGMRLELSIAGPGDQELGARQVAGVATATKGVCTAAMSVPLTGQYEVTAGNPAYMPTRHNAYWQTATATVKTTAARATAGLMVSVMPPAIGAGLGVDVGINRFDDAAVPVMVVGWGSPPMGVTVSVTDATGAPAVGVPVTLSSVSPSVVFTDPAPVTDQYGLAHAGAAWDPSRVPSAGCEDATISVVVPGVALVAGAPAPMKACRALTNQPMLAWIDGAASVAANGTDTITVRVRAWDDHGNPVTGRPERLHSELDFASVSALHPDPGALLNIGDPVWDAAKGWYSFTVTSTVAQQALLRIWFGDDYKPYGYLGWLEFKAGPMTQLVAEGDWMWASDGKCDRDLRATGWVSAAPADEYGNFSGDLPGGVVFSVPAGSPVKMLSDPVVPEQMEAGGYWLQVYVPVSGTFDVTVVSADGKWSAKTVVQADDAFIDAKASTFSLSPGPRLADGKDAYVMTANLVSVCHVPITDLETGTLTPADPYAAELVATDPATGKPAPAAKIGDWAPDTAKPGTYSVRVTSSVAGTYALTVNSIEWMMAATPVQQTIPLGEPMMAKFVAPPVNPNNPAKPPAGAKAPTGGTVGGSSGAGLVAGLVLLSIGTAVALARRAGVRRT